MRTLTTTLMLITFVLLVSCDQESAANRGFTLPEGNAQNGQLVFVKHHCYQCHTLDAVEIPEAEWTLDGGQYMTVILGGESSKLQTYGDLVTSIINPSHRLAQGYPLIDIATDGKSNMANYNDVLKVSELIDLVTFLKLQYRFRKEPYTNYQYYKYTK